MIDNDNCTSKFSRFFATREEAEFFMTKLKELAAAILCDEGASVAYTIEDLEGESSARCGLHFLMRGRDDYFELSLRC
ncbi:DUF406 family protein [Shigella boydii]